MWSRVARRSFPLSFRERARGEGLSDRDWLNEAERAARQVSYAAASPSPLPASLREAVPLPEAGEGICGSKHPAMYPERSQHLARNLLDRSMRGAQHRDALGAE